MKLEGLDEQDEEDSVFCWSCGKQLYTIDEIAQRICPECKVNMKKISDDTTFFCWACGKKLAEISEVAQGVCHQCKADIIRKIQSPQKKNISVDV
jgi:DNA-directed RNA polymerase subunit RPC12/RpoP